MKTVFEAATGLEAHMILNLLNQEGIDGRVEGEYLQGGVGEIAAVNVVRVVVDDADVERARSIISTWESAQTNNTPIDKPSRRPPRAVLGFLLGLLVGVGGMYWGYNSPVTSQGIDHNGDGTLDEVWIYKGDRISRAEVDRNFDGRVDLIHEYDRKGIMHRALSDDDFDGHFEAVTAYKSGNPILTESDLNQDGTVDHRASYKHGLMEVVEIIDPVTRAVRKRQHFVMGKLSSAEFDSNGDGVFDVTYQYDFYEEVKETSP